MTRSAPTWTDSRGCTRLLLPVDGSPRSLAAVRHAVALSATQRAPATLVLLNVQAPVRGNIGRFIAEADLQRYHGDEGRKALRKAGRLAQEAGLVHESHVVVGDVVAAILDAAERHDCQAIVLANRGHGGLSGVLLGSVSMRLLHHSPRPVILVRS
ncbi:MAG: universal stress protein [Betaproteobacteria bacterium]|nr:universal stress protein [Betaproteobacteria bacterium]